MGYTLDDMFKFAQTMSDKDVKIARQEIAMEALQKQCQQLRQQVDVLHEQGDFWKAAALAVSAQNEDLRQQMTHMHRVILLSVKKVSNYFYHIDDVKLQALLRAFVLDALPDDTPPELLGFIQQVTRLRLPQPQEPHEVHVHGNYNDVHDNGKVNV